MYSRGAPKVFFFLLTSATDVFSLRISSLDIEEMDIREPLLSCGVLGAREDLIPVFTCHIVNLSGNKLSLVRWGKFLEKLWCCFGGRV